MKYEHILELLDSAPSDSPTPLNENITLDMMRDHAKMIVRVYLGEYNKKAAEFFQILPVLNKMEELLDNKAVFPILRSFETATAEDLEEQLSESADPLEDLKGRLRFKYDGMFERSFQMVPVYKEWSRNLGADAATAMLAPFFDAFVKIPQLRVNAEYAVAFLALLKAYGERPFAVKKAALSGLDEFQAALPKVTADNLFILPGRIPL